MVEESDSESSEAFILVLGLRRRDYHEQIKTEKYHDMVDSTLSEIYIADEENKMSLYSHMFSIWLGSNRKIWCAERRASCSVENFTLQSFFSWRI